MAPSSADGAAGELLAELAAGRRPRGELGRLLREALGSPDEPAPSDAAQAAGMWVSSSSRERGEALRDLLLLTDRLPVPRTRARERFPRLDSSAA